MKTMCSEKGQVRTAGSSETDRVEPVVCSWFDDQIAILAIHDGPVLGIQATLDATAAVRGAILSQFPSHQQIPEWISGHCGDGRPSQRCHLAIIPLPFVDARFADGHLLGLGLAFPRQLPYAEKTALLSKLVVDQQSGQEKLVKLRMGRLGVVSLQRETRHTPPPPLCGSTWSSPSRQWTTVTPIVLDRFPKSDPRKDRVRWTAEVASILQVSSTRIGLPRPVEVAVNQTAYLSGVPQAAPGSGGFPPFPVRKGNGSRLAVHAVLRFDQTVRGPLLLGAGRYLGYGLCKPWRGAAARQAAIG